MSETAPLLEQARALGEALARDVRVQKYFDAQRAALSDATAQEALREFELQRNHILSLEQQQKPVEVADKHKLAELQSRVAGHATLKALLKAQADYVELMRRVNETMEAPLAKLRTPEPHP